MGRAAARAGHRLWGLEADSCYSRPRALLRGKVRRTFHLGKDHS